MKIRVVLLSVFMLGVFGVKCEQGKEAPGPSPSTRLIKVRIPEVGEKLIDTPRMECFKFCAEYAGNCPSIKGRALGAEIISEQEYRECFGDYGLAQEIKRGCEEVCSAHNYNIPIVKKEMDARAEQYILSIQCWRRCLMICDQTYPKPSFEHADCRLACLPYKSDKCPNWEWGMKGN